MVFPYDDVSLPPLSRAEEMGLEYDILGLSTGEHAIASYRPWLAKQRVLGSEDFKACASGREVRVGGMVVVHQAPPTAKGFHFITLEDEEGLIDVVVRPDTYARYRRVLLGSPLLIVEGAVQRKDGVVNLLAQRAAAIPRLDRL